MIPEIQPADAAAVAWWLGGGMLICIVVAAIWLRRVHLADRVQHWRTTDGEILSSDIVEVPTSEDDHYQARVAYRYRVNGHNFTGRQIRVGPKKLVFPQRSRAVSVIQTYSAGTRVTVHYDPVRPENAVLEPVAAPNGLTGWAIMGGFMALSGIYILFTLPKVH